MPDLIIPTVGSSGNFLLRAPFDQVVLPKERYTCQGVRKISDYLANNEDVKADIYDANGIPEAEYDDDVQKDMLIASLQGETGQWVSVPVRYLISYPITNGIPYRTMMIGAALPPLPADRDLSFLLTEISNLIKDSLGVEPDMDLMETSMVILVDRDKHDVAQAQRDAVSNGRTTDRSRLIQTQTQLTVALAKITELETYIKTHHVNN